MSSQYGAIHYWLIMINRRNEQGEAITSANWATFYNLEVVISLAFRLNTYEASRIRAKVLEGLYMRNKSEINMFITLKSERNDKYYQAEQNNLQ